MCSVRSQLLYYKVLLVFDLCQLICCKHSIVMVPLRCTNYMSHKYMYVCVYLLLLQARNSHLHQSDNLMVQLNSRQRGIHLCPAIFASESSPILVSCLCLVYLTSVASPLVCYLFLFIYLICQGGAHPGLLLIFSFYNQRSVPTSLSLMFRFFMQKGVPTSLLSFYFFAYTYITKRGTPLLCSWCRSVVFMTREASPLVNGPCQASLLLLVMINWYPYDYFLFQPHFVDRCISYFYCRDLTVNLISCTAHMGVQVFQLSISLFASLSFILLSYEQMSHLSINNALSYKCNKNCVTGHVYFHIFCLWYNLFKLFVCQMSP